MAKTRLTQRIRHRPQDLIDFVSDVEAYPEFINLISALRVTQRKEISEGHERFEAQATVSYKFIREDFSSVVDVYNKEHRIEVRKSERSGMVKTLQNDWIFHELSDGTTLVEFLIEVRLKAFPLEVLLREKFDKITAHIMDLFERKAGQCYDKIGDEKLELDREYKRLGLKPDESHMSLSS